jgi:metal-responsive CopG/Arc/MetJ family transcriptional regulator
MLRIKALSSAQGHLSSEDSKMRRRVNLSLKPALVVKFDRARGDMPRSRVIARLLEEFIKNQECAANVTSQMDAAANAATIARERDEELTIN